MTDERMGELLFQALVDHLCTHPEYLETIRERITVTAHEMGVSKKETDAFFARLACHILKMLSTSEESP